MARPALPPEHQARLRDIRRHLDGVILAIAATHTSTTTPDLSEAARAARVPLYAEYDAASKLWRQAAREARMAQIELEDADDGMGL